MDACIICGDTSIGNCPWCRSKPHNVVVQHSLQLTKQQNAQVSRLYVEKCRELMKSGEPPPYASMLAMTHTRQEQKRIEATEAMKAEIERKKRRVHNGNRR